MSHIARLKIHEKKYAWLVTISRRGYKNAARLRVLNDSRRIKKKIAKIEAKKKKKEKK